MADLPEEANVPSQSPEHEHMQKGIPKKTLIIGGAVMGALLIVGGAYAAIKHRKTDSSAQVETVASGFNFGDCLRDHTKPGEDPHIANDACLLLQAAAQGGTTSPSPVVTVSPLVSALPSPSPSANPLANADPNSTDPMAKGLALANGQCSGTGSAKLTHAPMDMKDVETIQPMGLMAAGHVTPVDHEYYYQKNFSAPKDSYPVYATMDGTIVAAGHVGNAWSIVISHSCTFFQQYNLMTSMEASLQAQLPEGWGPNSNGGVKIPVKAGQIVGYVGGQSLDFCVWDTEKTLSGFLYKTAYNNREAWKVNTVPPLDYFTDEVKAEILPKYVRTVEPRDGKIDYDVKGQAVGNWFVEGSNGYAGGTSGDGTTAEYATHLALAYDYIDPTAPIFSIGDYNGSPTQFAVKGSVDWTKITKDTGLVKLELAQVTRMTPSGAVWAGKFTTGVTVKPGPTQATALIQMTEDEKMKVQVFAGKTPVQVSAFTSAAKMYNRGQDAVMLTSTTAH